MLTQRGQGIVICNRRARCSRSPRWDCGRLRMFQSRPTLLIGHQFDAAVLSLFLSCEAILAHPPSIEPNGAAGLADAHHLFLRGPKETEIDPFGKHSG